MRFLMREMKYEKPAASGTLRYERRLQPTGLLETWRFSHALDGYSFLRIEMDTNSPQNQNICLYHILLNPERGIERLKFRCFEARTEIDGDLQFDGRAISVNRVVTSKDNGTRERFEEEIPLKSEAIFWFPSISGQGLAAAKVAKNGPRPIIILDREKDFAIRQGSAHFTWGEEEDMTVLRHKVAVRPCSITWDTSTIRLWIDDHSWPVYATCDDGTTAAEIAYVRYQQANLDGVDQSYTE